jgi:cell wall-associated NlpC family hydrolase
MKSFITLLFSASLISTFGVAKHSKIDNRYEVKSAKKSTHKSTKYAIQNGDTLFAIARKNHTSIDAIREANGIAKGEELKIGRSIKIPSGTTVEAKAKSEPVKLVLEDKKSKEKTKAASKHSDIKKNTTAEHTIQNGDTLFAIARKNNTSIDAIREANGIAKGEELKIGRSIKIPSGTTVEAKAKSESMKLVLDEKKDKEKTKAASKHSDKKKSTTAEHIATATKSYKVKKSDSLYSIAKCNGTTIEDLKKANHISSNKSLKVGQILLLSTSSKDSHTKTIKLTQKHDKLEIRKASSNRVVLEPKPTKKSFLALFGEEDILSTGRTSTKQKAIPQAAKKYLGKRYVLGATGPYNFDCSGFTSYVCKKNGVSLPRTSIDQSRVGKKVARSNLKAGDLIFFDTSRSRRGYVNHVGIYMGNNKFIHASSSKRKVIITTLDGSFYDSRFKGGRRVAS